VTSRAHAARWLSVAVLGVALGVATAWSDVIAGGLEQDGMSRALSMALNSGSAWAALAALGGWLIGRPIASALAGFVALLAAIAAYYLFGVLAGDRAQVGFAGIGGAVRMWALLAVVAGPILGVAGAMIRRPGKTGLLAALVVPAGVTVEMLGLRRLGGETFAVDPALAWAQTVMVVGAILGAGCVLAVRLRPFVDQPRDRVDTRRIP
jgi:hypothetical protein